MPEDKNFKETILAKGTEIAVISGGDDNDYISLTDIAKYKTDENPGYVIQNWMRNRNLIFLLTLYSYFLNDTFKRFNLVCIEEPESHLDINNLNIAIEFFQKAQGKNTLTRLVISTHSNQVMNKLELTNVVLLLDNDHVIDLSSIDSDFVYYLAKRENFDTLNMFYASKLIMVEGATEEIYINSLLQHDSSLNNIRVLPE